MFRAWKLAPNTVSQRLAALRFFYIQVLKRGWSTAETPYPKKVLRLPQMLSQEEVARLIDAAETPFYRMLLMTLYATGARRAEVAALKISDIDSQRMVVHIRGGKGRKDRDVMLSPALLEALRAYWRGLRHKPTDWLFPGNRWHTVEPARHHQGALAGLRQAANGPVSSTGTSIRIRCAIALQRICSKPEPTCAPSRCCSDIAISKRPRSTCTCPSKHLSATASPLDALHVRSTGEARTRSVEPRLRWRWPISFATPDRASSNAADAGSTGSIRRCCSRSRAAAPLLSAAIATAARAAAITAISYNSCRNRHCPRCQANARVRWLQQRERELLPTRYVHVVFTLPRELAPLALQNKRVIYGLLFRASAATLAVRSPAILATWARRSASSACSIAGISGCSFIHMSTASIAAGGLAPDHARWISSRTASSCQ